MAKSTTYKGAPKPFGASGHFDEPTRHALQAKGIRTGNLANNPAVYEKWGIANLERAPIDTTPRTSTGLEDVEAEVREEKAPPRESLTERFNRMKEEFNEAKRQRQAEKASERRRKLYEEVGREPEEETAPEQEEGEGGEDIEVEDESVPMRLGQFLADLNGGYDKEDMAGLNNKELETLAVRFKSENEGSFFGEPENVFLDELKDRLRAQAEMNREKARIHAEIRAELAHPEKKEEGFFSGLFGDEPEEKVSNRKPREKGFLEDFFS